MSYTIEWYRPANLPADKFEKYARDCKKIIMASRKRKMPVGPVGDDVRATASPESVRFSGGKDGKIDDFILKRELGKEAKTDDNGKVWEKCEVGDFNYGIFVRSAIISLKHYFPEVEIKELPIHKGTCIDEIWIKAKQLCKLNFGYGEDICPGGIADMRKALEQIDKKETGKDKNKKASEVKRTEAQAVV